MTSAIQNIIAACPALYLLVRPGNQIDGYTRSKDKALDTAEQNGWRVVWRTGSDVWEWSEKGGAQLINEKQES